MKARHAIAAGALLLLMGTGKVVRAIRETPATWFAAETPVRVLGTHEGERLGVGEASTAIQAASSADDNE